MLKPTDYLAAVFSGRLQLESQVAICAYLAYRATTAADRFGWFRVTQDEIAECCRLSRRTVQRQLHWLADNDWIDARQVVERGRYRRKMYRLKHPSSVPHSGRHSGRHGDAYPTPPRRHGDALKVTRSTRGDDATLYSNYVFDSGPPRPDVENVVEQTGEEPIRGAQITRILRGLADSTEIA